jgi:thioesterase domain-containing protein
MKSGEKGRKGMAYSAAQAAKAAGVSTATITRAIEKGRISAQKNERGAWQIDPAELHRAFAMKSPGTPPLQRHATPRNAEELQRDLELAAEKLLSAQTLNDRLQDEVRDLRTRLDGEAEERRRLVAIVTDQRSQSAASTPRTSWWSWFPRR